MKGRTKKNIAFVFSVLIFIIGIVSIMFVSYKSIMELLGKLTTTMCAGLYAWALKKQKVKTATVTYDLFLVSGIVCFIPLLLLLLSVRTFEHLIMIGFLFLLFGVPFGLVLFIWWLGLKGLEQTIREEKNERR